MVSRRVHHVIAADKAVTLSGRRRLRLRPEARTVTRFFFCLEPASVRHPPVIIIGINLLFRLFRPRGSASGAAAVGGLGL